MPNFLTPCQLPRWGGYGQVPRQPIIRGKKDSQDVIACPSVSPDPPRTAAAPPVFKFEPPLRSPGRPQRSPSSPPLVSSSHRTTPTHLDSDSSRLAQPRVTLPLRWRPPPHPPRSRCASFCACARSSRRRPPLQRRPASPCSGATPAARSPSSSRTSTPGTPFQIVTLV